MTTSDQSALIAEAKSRVDFEDHPDEWLDLIARLGAALEEAEARAHKAERWIADEVYARGTLHPVAETETEMPLRMVSKHDPALVIPLSWFRDESDLGEPSFQATIAGNEHTNRFYHADFVIHPAHETTESEKN